MLKQVSRKCFSTLARPLILGIETSCDDTGAAVMDDTGRVHGEAVNSQQNIHLKYGGIIPPIAQDLHRMHIESVVAECLDRANCTISDLSAIAVTNRPGLPMSLVVGVRYAKHLARTHNRPLIPIHHMEAHALTARINNPGLQYPFLCLLASGGHSLLAYVKSVSEFYLLGESLDDAPGELFDKIARDLKLRNLKEYEWLSGGAAIEKAARLSQEPTRFEYPMPLAHYRDCQFSYSGMKNTARKHLREMEAKFELRPDEVIPNVEDYCAGLLRAVARHICHRTQRAIEFCVREGMFEEGNAANSLVFSGGVACNDFIFEAVDHMAAEFGFRTVRPEKRYCTDNGVMIAWNGVEKYQEGLDIHAKGDINRITVIKKCPLGSSLIDRVKAMNLSCKWVKNPKLHPSSSSSSVKQSSSCSQ